MLESPKRRLSILSISLEQSRDEISYDFYQASTLKLETELVDPLRPAMVHEHPPIADSRLGRYSRFVRCDHDRPTWEKRQKRWYNLLPFPFPAILMGVCAFGVGHQTSLSTGAWRSLWDSVRDSVPLPADDHFICGSSRNCDSTRPRGSPQKVIGTQEPQDSERSNYSFPKRETFDMTQPLHVRCSKRHHRTVHVIGRSLRAHGYEMRGQLHHHPGASVREKSSLGRLSLPMKIVLSAVREHEEVICPGHNHGQRSDFPWRNNSTLTVST